MEFINTQSLINLTLTFSIVASFITALVLKSREKMKKAPILIKIK